MTVENCRFRETGIAAALGTLGSGAWISQKGLAKLLECSPITIKRAVRRGELPAPVKMFGELVWTAGTILRHVEARLEQAARDAEIVSQNTT